MKRAPENPMNDMPPSGPMPPGPGMPPAQDAGFDTFMQNANVMRTLHKGTHVPVWVPHQHLSKVMSMPGVILHPNVNPKALHK